MKMWIPNRTASWTHTLKTNLIFLTGSWVKCLMLWHDSASITCPVTLVSVWHEFFKSNQHRNCYMHHCQLSFVRHYIKYIYIYVHQYLSGRSWFSIVFFKMLKCFKHDMPCSLPLTEHKGHYHLSCVPDCYTFVTITIMQI